MMVMKHIVFAVFLLIGILGFAHISAAVLPSPEIIISSASFQQADTLKVVVKNEPGEITGKLGTVKARFFRNETGQDWVAFIGMPHNKLPGTYKLTVMVPGKALFQKSIKVAKRKYPVTNLVITPDLSKKGYTVKSIVQTVINEENKAINKVLSTINPSTYVIKPFIYPLSEIAITGGYGDIRVAKNYKIQHLGIDLKAPLDTPVLAVNDGVVVFTKNMPDYGNTLIIDHGLGVYSLYLHLSQFNVAANQAVKQGDVVALSGATGYATGPHLHFSIKMRGSSIDPLKFIEATQGEW